MYVSEDIGAAKRAKKEWEMHICGALLAYQNTHYSCTELYLVLIVNF